MAVEYEGQSEHFSVRIEAQSIHNPDEIDIFILNREHLTIPITLDPYKKGISLSDVLSLKGPEEVAEKLQKPKEKPTIRSLASLSPAERTHAVSLFAGKEVHELDPQTTLRTFKRMRSIEEAVRNGTIYLHEHNPS